MLELLVVIALLGLVLAIAAPTFILPAAKPDTALTSIVSSARRAAILRAEPVTLSFEAGGEWRIDGDVTAGASPLATGKLASSVGTLRIHMSPLGTCVADVGTSTASRDWNAVDCRFTGAQREASR